MIDVTHLACLRATVVGLVFFLVPAAPLYAPEVAGDWGPVHISRPFANKKLFFTPVPTSLVMIHAVTSAVATSAASAVGAAHPAAAAVVRIACGESAGSGNKSTPCSRSHRHISLSPSALANLTRLWKRGGMGATGRGCTLASRLHRPQCQTSTAVPASAVDKSPLTGNIHWRRVAAAVVVVVIPHSELLWRRAARGATWRRQLL